MAEKRNPGTLCTRMDENYGEALTLTHIREWFFATEAVQDQSKSTFRRSPARKIGLLHKPHYFVRFGRERDGPTTVCASSLPHSTGFSLSHSCTRSNFRRRVVVSPPFSVDAKLERKWKQAGKQFSLWYKEGGIALIVCGSAQRDAWGARYLQEGGEMSDAELHPANYTHYAVSALHTWVFNVPWESCDFLELCTEQAAAFHANIIGLFAPGKKQLGDTKGLSKKRLLQHFTQFELRVGIVFLLNRLRKN